MSRITTDCPPPSLLLTSPPLQSLKGLKQRWSAFPRRLTTRPVVAQVTAHMSLICGAPGAVVVERGGVLKKKKGGGGKKQSLMKTENFGRLNLKWLLLWGGDGKHTTGFTVTRLHTCWVSLITQSARNTTGCCEWTGLARNSYCVYKCRSMGWTLLCGNLLSPFQTPSAALVTRLLNYRLFLKTRKSPFQLISVNLC